MLGSIYWLDLKRPAKGIDYFQMATQLSPESKSASLGLFHTLWEMDEQADALEEMKRFQSISHCEDYDEILAELTEKGLTA